MVQASLSPASLPSLAATSSDGDDSRQRDDDYPPQNMWDEVRGDISKSYSVAVEDEYMAHSWREEEEDEDVMESNSDVEEYEMEANASRVSSGILSVEDSLEVDFNEMHSLSSAKTLKSGAHHEEEEEEEDLDAHYDTLADNVQYHTLEFEHVTGDEVPLYHRACHGGLNITPRQLAEVFSMFASDRIKETNSEPKSPQDPGSQKAKPERTCARRRSPPLDDPYTVQDRFKSQPRASQPKLTAEMYWRPRAQNLEKECQTLKEILAEDSSKILQLKGALETLRGEKLRSLVEIKSYQEQLVATQQDMKALRKERAEWREEAMDHVDTIQILKQEVDMLTRGVNAAERSIQPTGPPGDHEELLQLRLDQDELRMLRLENHLFAAQIIDYEVELKRLERHIKYLQNSSKRDASVRQAGGIHQEVQVVQELVEDGLSARSPLSEWNQNKELPHVVDTNAAAPPDDTDTENKENSPPSQGSPNDFLKSARAVAVVTCMEEDSEDTETISDSMDEEDVYIETVEETEVTERIVEDTECSAEDTERVDTERVDVACKTRIAIEKVELNVHDETMKGDEVGTSKPDTIMQHLASGMATDFPRQILGNILGMLPLGGTEDGKECDEVLIIQETAPTSSTSADVINYLQWLLPDQVASFVQLEKIVPVDEVDDRNPPSKTSAVDPALVSSNPANPPMRKVLAQLAIKQTTGKEDSCIHVHDNGDSTQSVEVQLTPRVPETSTEKCDLWNALSCPFASSNGA